MEFLIPAKSNSGVYLHGLYEVQVYDSFGVEHPEYLDCGGIYERWINNKGEGGTPPSCERKPPSGRMAVVSHLVSRTEFDASGRRSQR